MRFRPVSSPGPAATGAPADRTAELAAELIPTLTLVDREILSARTGIRIEDEDTPRLTTLDGCTQFLLERAESVPR